MFATIQNLLSTNQLTKSMKIKIYKIIISPDALYGCETWSLILREELRMLWWIFLLKSIQRNAGEVT
jgi:hypothetical protein